MTDCLFCRIVSGEIPATRVGENEGAIAFQDINPAAPTHVLVVPRLHIDSLADLDFDDPEHQHAWAASGRLAKEVAGRQQGGWRLVSNIGEDARQSVPHLHLHVLAGRRFDWPPG